MDKSTSDLRRLIALDYLSLAAEDMLNKNKSADELYAAARARLHYLKLALQYGCLKSEIRLALGITSQHLDQLIKTID
jgi:hypothetical protein